MSERFGLNKENKGAVDAAIDFPKLKLEKKGDVARLAIFGIGQTSDGKQQLVVPDPEGGHYFGLRVPGHQREFQGNYECLADAATKAEGGFDPDACPHCKYALAGNVSEEVMSKRQRRFVLPVVRYKTQPGTSNLVTPYSVEVLAWAFTDRYFNTLVDENDKWAASGGLLGHDITLTCEVPQWQNFKISVEPDAAYKNDRALGQLVLETYVNQTSTLPEGLGKKLGQKLNAVDLEKKIADTIEAAAQLGVGGPVVAPAATLDPATVQNLAADLMGGTAAPAAETPVVVQAVPEVPEVVAAETPAQVVEESPAVDFDSFFNAD